MIRRVLQVIDSLKAVERASANGSSAAYPPSASSKRTTSAGGSRVGGDSAVRQISQRGTANPSPNVRQRPPVRTSSPLPRKGTRTTNTNMAGANSTERRPSTNTTERQLVSATTNRSFSRGAS